MEQYNRLASENLVDEAKKEIKNDLISSLSYQSSSASSLAAVTAVTTYPSYAWNTTSNSTWLTDPNSTWPYYNNNGDTATYNPYLTSQFHGFLSAASINTTSNIQYSNKITYSNAPTSSLLPHIAGGKFQTSRLNCECPNCQEAERIGLLFFFKRLNYFFNYFFNHFYLLILIIFFKIQSDYYWKTLW